MNKLKSTINFLTKKIKQLCSKTQSCIIKFEKSTIHSLPNKIKNIFIDEALDLELMAGTRFKIFEPLHRSIAKKSRLYYKYHRLKYVSKINFGALAAAVIVSAGISYTELNQKLAKTPAPFNGLKTVTVTEINPDAKTANNTESTLLGNNSEITAEMNGYAVEMVDKNTKSADFTVSTKNKSGQKRSLTFNMLVPKEKDSAQSINKIKNNRLANSEAVAEDSIEIPTQKTSSEIKSEKAISSDITIKENNEETNSYKLAVTPSIEVQYKISDNKIKEDIIINSPDAFGGVASLDFNVDLNDLSLNKLENGVYSFCDSVTGEKIFSLTSPTLNDRNNQFYNDQISLVFDMANNIASYQINPELLVKAARENLYPLTIDPTVIVTTSTTTNPNSYSKDHTLYEATNGSLINVYSDGSALNYRISTDHGNTWGDATSIVTTATADDTGFSGWIDNNNFIHLTYSNNGTNSYIFYKKLTFNTADNTISQGTEQTIESAGTTQAFPSITVGIDNTIYAVYRYYDGTDYTIKVKSSTDGATWTASTTLSAATNTSSDTYPNIFIWKDKPAVIYNFANSSLLWNYFDGSAWQSAGWTNETITTEVDADTALDFTVSETSDNYIHLAWRGSGTNGILYRKNTNAVASWETSSTAITAVHNDKNPNLGLGLNDSLYLYYSEYVDADSYNIKYTEKIGNAAFPTTKISVTTDNANNLIPQAALKPTKTTTSTNYAINYNGTSQYTNLGSPTNLRPTDSLTVSAWFNRKGVGNATYDYIVAYDTGYRINYTPSEGKLHYVIDTTAGSALAFAGNTTIAIDTWYQVTMTYDSTTGDLKGYINGSLDGSQNFGAGKIIYSSYNLAIGARYSYSASYHFKGIIDEVHIYNRVLTTTEITNQYNNGVIKAGITNGLIGAWHMDENTGTTAYEYSGISKVNGTLAGTPTWVSTTPQQINSTEAKFPLSPVIFVEGTSSPYNLKYAPQAKRWTAASAGNWSTAGNWTPSGTPAAGDIIIFDASSVQNCAVDSIADQIGGIYTLQGYTGSITFNTHPSLNADTFNINVVGEIAINAGTVISKGDVTVQHNGITDGQGNTYTAYNISIGSASNFNADAQGFTPASGGGPGKSTSYEIGAAYAGKGGRTGYSDGLVNEISYGDYSDPVSLGSANTYSDPSTGGGAISFSSSNSIIVNGILSATSQDTSMGSTGSGGSLNMTAGTISGVGTISANSGISKNWVSGSGGRIKINATAINFSGRLEAKPGSSGNPNFDAYPGSAGTIYKKLTSQTYGDLIISSNPVSTYRSQTGAHLKDPADTGTYRFDSITFSNYGRLAIDAGQTLDYANSNITGDKNSGIINIGTIAVPNDWTLSHYFSSKNGSLSNWTSKNMTIASGGFLTHYFNTNAETYKLNWTLDSLTVQSGGEINVNGGGYRCSYGSGQSTSYYSGASYGGSGGKSTNGEAGPTYGDYSNPINLGSATPCNPNEIGSGGGAVILTIAGDLTIESGGTISANSFDTTVYGAGSGGSVNITANNILGSGTITTNGGKTVSNYGGGGGGRMKLAGGSISSSLTLQAKGGSSGASSLYTSGTAGTIYKKLTSQTYGDLIIDNGSINPTTRVQIGAHLKDPADTGTYRFDSITFSNYGRLTIDAGQTLDYINSNVTGDKNSGIINAGTMTVSNNWILSCFYSSKNGIISGWASKNITISSTGLLTHYPNFNSETYKLDWTLDSLTVQSGGEVNVNEVGYAPSQGTGKPNNYNYAGASYGGEGGIYNSSYSSVTYGDYSNPTNLGSGAYTGGGGAIILNISGTIDVQTGGTISSNGGSITNYGAGSGGSINLTAANITGGGNITANGGSGNNYGSGGGGRIKIASTAFDHTGQLQAYSGINSSITYRGSAGTIYKKLASQTYGDLIINNSTNAPSTRNQMSAHLKDPADTGSYRFDSITLSNYGRLAIDANQTLDYINSNVTGDKNSGIINAGTMTVPNDWTLSHFYSDKNGTLSNWTSKNMTVSSTGFLTHYPNTNAETYKLNWTLDSLTVQSGGELNVNEVGYGSGQGTGKPTNYNYAGASYGGIGGVYSSSYSGGPSYGDYSNPINIGSGAYTGGGGAIILNITGTIDIKTGGSISSNGGTHTSYGTGSGGSVNLTANTITGEGSITANGGTGNNYGNGGGGRIKLAGTAINHTGLIQACSGTNTSSTYRGSAGTIYKKLSNQTYGDLIIDNTNGGSSSKYTPLSTPISITSLLIQNYGKLQVDTNADPAQNNLTISDNLTVRADSELKLMSDTDGTPAEGAWPKITVGGNVSVAGTITANGTGFIHDTGYSSGKGLVVNSVGSGGGYGGAGGNSSTAAQGGQAYGTEVNNSFIGSGGGNTNGGAGGGMIKMNVAGSFDITSTGTVSANGDNSGASGGGGSGGSIQVLINGTLTATTGSKITANGGTGGATGGGGGGGGRISLYPSAETTTGATITATGGAGNGSGVTGSDGTIRIQHGPTSPTVTAPTNDGAINQSQRIAFHFNSTDEDGDWLQYKLQMATDSGFTQNLSTFDQSSSQSPSDGGRSAEFSGQDHASVGYESGTDAVLTITTNLHQGDTFYYRIYAWDPEGVDSFDGTEHWSAPSSTRSFTVAPIARFAFTTGVQNIYVTNCSAQLGIQIQNSINESVTLTETEGSINVTLSTTSGTGSFYSDGSCNTAIPSNTITVPIGSSGGSFFYKDTTPSVIGTPWVMTVSESPSKNWADGTQQITIKPGAFGFLEISGYPAQVVAGESFASPANDVSVTVKDIYGNVKNDWTGQIWFYSSDSAATFSYNDQGRYTFTSGLGLDNGTHTFTGSGFTLRQAGNQSLVVHNTEGAEYDAIGNINVIPADLDHFGMTSYPRSQSSLYAMSSMDWSSVISAGPYNPRVTAYDAFNNVKTDFTGALWFELYKNTDTPGDPEASTASYAFTNDFNNPYTYIGADSGAHTFNGTSFLVSTSADNLRFRVKTDSSNGDKYTDFTISIKPQTLDHFIIETSPALSRNGTEGEKQVDTALTEDVIVTAYDGYGNIKTDYGYDESSSYGKIYFYSSDALATLPYKKATTADSTSCFNFPASDLGIHTFTPENTPTNYFTFKTGGYQTLSVSECIDPSSTYATDPITNKYDPNLEPTNTEKIAASTGTLPATTSTPNKIYITPHTPGSTHTAIDHTNDTNDLISADPGHQQAILSWHNPFDIPTEAALEPGAYIYRCSENCDNTANYSKVVTTPAVINVTPNSWSTYTDTGLTNATTYYYKVSYGYKKQDSSFLESDKSISVSATPADIAPREVVAIQLDKNDSQNAGKVKVDFKLRWNSTVSLAYFNPTTNAWANASIGAQSGDIGTGITGSEELTSHTAYFNPNIDFDGQYLVDSFKMRVKVVVNSANAYSDSELITLDSKNPAEATMVVDATKQSTADLALHATDDSGPIQMKISTNSDFSDTNWEDYAESKSNFALDGKTTVYAVFRDSFDNQTLLTNNLLNTPQNVTLKDGSNISSDKFRLLLIWDDILPVPEGYQIYKSTDGIEYSMVETTVKNAFIDINLNQDTTYYYKVQGRDSSGNLSIPSLPIHSKPGAGPDVVSAPQVEIFGWKQDLGVRAKISWNTDQNADSFVAYSTEPIAEGTSLSTVSGSADKVKIVGQPDLTLDHEIMLSNLEPSTKYYYKVLSKNEIQITGYSPVYEFTTPERILLQISGVTISDIEQKSAQVNWLTSKPSTSILEYGTTTSYGQKIEETTLNTEHKFKLENLVDGQTYHLRIKAIDTDQNTTTSDDYVFQTPAMPTISEAKVMEIGSNSATITWITNVNSDSNVEFSSTVPVITQVQEGRANDSSAPLAIQTGKQGKSDSTTIHSVTIIGLVDKTTYKAQAISKDQFGNEAISNEITFSTVTDTTSPKINDLQSEITSTGSGDTVRYQAVISWNTDESSTSQIEYGQGVGGGYDQSTKEDLSLNQTHVVILNDLKSNSSYHFRVKTSDKSGNSSYSDDTSIITPAKTKSLIQMIVNTISDSFSWMKKYRQKFN